LVLDGFDAIIYRMNYNQQAPAINISKLHIRYNHHWLFNQFDFYLPANQCTCLLGPSGIGKTTLLRFIAGLQHDKDTEYSGCIITSDDKPLNGRIAYMTQKDSLLPWLNVLDNVLLGFYLRNEKIDIELELEQRAHALLEKVGLKYVKNLKPEKLSQGMRQRVVLVRTLIEDRQVILMDEPFSSLDTITRLKLQDLTASLLVNRTIVLVTHDPLEALRLGHCIYIISGSPAKIIHTIKPQGAVPRKVDDPGLLTEQAKLLQTLANNEFEI